MKVECEHCGARFNVPDEKLVPGTEFSFNCPKCQEKNSVDVPASGTAGSSDEERGGVGEFYEEGAKLALICFDAGSARDALVKSAADLNFTPVIPSSARDALQRIRLTQFRAILLDENFDGQETGSNAILRLIQPMEMATRRRIFVALFGKGYTTMDHMSAFALSVNTVINTSDEKMFSKILQRAVMEYERFYKVYFDVMREMGKA